MRHLLAVMTCRKNAEKAAAQRATWVADIRKSGAADVVFFLGAPQGNHKLNSADYWERNGDEVTLFSVDDSYFGLTAKVQGICAWGAAQGYSRISKLDDDVYVAPLRFPSLPFAEHDYVGRSRGPHGNYPAHFASGFFYTLSKKAASIIAHTSWNGDWLEERFISNSLALNNLFCYTDSVNYLVTGPFTPASAILQRKVLSSGTVFCEYSAKQQYEMHKYLRFAPPVVGHPVLREVPRVSITLEQFNAPPCDKPPQQKIERYAR